MQRLHAEVISMKFGRRCIILSDSWGTELNQHYLEKAGNRLFVAIFEM
jgi:hypothetical protein